jgi:hypothetical protein
MYCYYPELEIYNFPLQHLEEQISKGQKVSLHIEVS